MERTLRALTVSAKLVALELDRGIVHLPGRPVRARAEQRVAAVRRAIVKAEAVLAAMEKGPQ